MRAWVLCFHGQGWSAGRSHTVGPHLGGVNLAYTESVPEIGTVLHAYLNTPHADRHHFTTKGDALADAIRRHYADAMLAMVSQLTVISKRQIDRSIVGNGRSTPA